MEKCGKDPRDDINPQKSNGRCEKRQFPVSVLRLDIARITSQRGTRSRPTLTVSRFPPRGKRKNEIRQQNERGQLSDSPEKKKIKKPNGTVTVSNYWRLFHSFRFRYGRSAVVRERATESKREKSSRNAPSSIACTHHARAYLTSINYSMVNIIIRNISDATSRRYAQCDNILYTRDIAVKKYIVPAGCDPPPPSRNNRCFYRLPPPATRGGRGHRRRRRRPWRPRRRRRRGGNQR